ncbi:MAG TPA: MBL fold metallo-hydrolase [Longimicrobium sp.]|nr:MBL fold metallo-hydrolase [Longimicrobium sp.]
MSAARLEPPRGGVVVRMYRQGHGDCFLLALPREGGGPPVYVMIDCGFAPGSPAFLNGGEIGDVVRHAGEATAWRLDLVVITHPHQDHLNGIGHPDAPYFGRFEIGEAWFAWTESPADPVAAELRRRRDAALAAIAATRDRLAWAVGHGHAAVRRVDALLALELGGPGDAPSPAAPLGPGGESANQRAIRLIREKARRGRGVRYLLPGEDPRTVPGSAVRAFVLGPPRTPGLSDDECPGEGEGVPPAGTAHGVSFAGAAGATGSAAAPFGPRYCVPLREAVRGAEPFLASHYGTGPQRPEADGAEVPDDAAWRRIDDEWLYPAEALALRLNRGTNNTSLVLALELPRSGKVLLFAGDAQRESWRSWAAHRWTDGGRTVTARELLGRTVLYKAGHHGSHDATPPGAPGDEHPNLSWMGQGAFGHEFSAMIPAVRAWAATRNDPPWRHPLPSIRRALLEKAGGRVFQTDVDRPERPANVPDGEWDEFLERAVLHDLYFDHVVMDR